MYYIRYDVLYEAVLERLQYWAKAENRQNEIDRLFAKMYEDRASERITERNFIMLSGKYQKEQIEIYYRFIGKVD